MDSVDDSRDIDDNSMEINRIDSAIKSDIDSVKEEVAIE